MTKYKAGTYLRKIRQRIKMSIKDMAETSGFSESFISDVETGKRFMTFPLFNFIADRIMTPSQTAELQMLIGDDLWKRWRNAGRNTGKAEETQS